MGPARNSSNEASKNHDSDACLHIGKKSRAHLPMPQQFCRQAVVLMVTSSQVCTSIYLHMVAGTEYAATMNPR